MCTCRPPLRRALNWALLLVVAVRPAGSQTPVAESGPAAEFQAVCERLRGGNNPYFSESLAAELEARLSGEAMAPGEEANVRGVLGRELLRLGRIPDSISQLQAAFELVGEAPEVESLRSAIHWHLALAHLQLAEDENCVAHRSADSCILPIRKGAVHSKPEHARRAGDLLTAYAAQHPRNIQASWLLNLARSLSGDFPQGVPESLRLSPQALSDVHQMAAWPERGVDLGINANDLAGGAIMDDFDGDGLLDLVSSTWDPCGGLKAFRNHGEGGFEDVTAAWGLADQLGGLNLLHADYDNDGRLDLLVLRGAWLLADGRIRNSLLRNTGEPSPRFVDVTAAAGMAQPAYPTQAAGWADYDGDGDLDLYVGNESAKAVSYPSQLFRNNGDGTFSDVAATAGVANYRYTKGVAWGDYDNDGDPDLYVSNFGENRLYRNDGKAGFTDTATSLGVTEPRVESFASWFFDYDNDGDLDLFVADYRSQAQRVTASYFGIPSEEGQPLIYRNDLVGSDDSLARFTEVSRSLGVRRPAMPMGANYGDLDNDGLLDIYLGTGEPDLASVMPNQMYRNTGKGFTEVTFSGRFAHLQKGHGIAFGDLDNDGDQDLFHQLGGFYPADVFGNALFENPLYTTGQPAAVANWITLQFVGKKSNRFGIGARVEAVIASEGATRSLHRVVGSGGSFGGSSLQLELGLGDAEAVQKLIVRWPGSEKESAFENVAAGHFYRVVEGASELETLSVSTFRLGG